MRFKLSGILLLTAASYFAISSLVALQQQRNDALTAQIQPLIAIFLVLLVRVLQTEKHHRDWLKQAADLHEKKTASEDTSIPALDELAMPPLEQELSQTDPLLESK